MLIYNVSAKNPGINDMVSEIENKFKYVDGIVLVPIQNMIYNPHIGIISDIKILLVLIFLFIKSYY